MAHWMRIDAVGGSISTKHYIVRNLYQHEYMFLSHIHAHMHGIYIRTLSALVGSLSSCRAIQTVKGQISILNQHPRKHIICRLRSVFLDGSPKSNRILFILLLRIFFDHNSRHDNNVFVVKIWSLVAIAVVPFEHQHQHTRIRPSQRHCGKGIMERAVFGSAYII